MQTKHTTSYFLRIAKLLSAALVVAVVFACAAQVAFAKTSESADSLEQRLKMDSLQSYDQTIASLSKESVFDAEPKSLRGTESGADSTLRLMEEEQDSQEQPTPGTPDPGTPDPSDPDPDAPGSDDPEPEVIPSLPTSAYATMAAPKIVWIKQISSSIEMSWSPVSGASGYYVYRCALKKGQAVPAAKDVAKWELVTRFAASKGCTWRDSKLSSGVRYAYRVQAYGKTKAYDFLKTADQQKPSGCLAQVPFRVEYLTSFKTAEGASAPYGCNLRCVSLVSDARKAGFLTAPEFVSYSKSKKSTKLKSKWEKVPGADGYQVQYAKNRLFTSYKTKTLKGASNVSLKIKGLKKTSAYHIRVRAYLEVDGTKVYSPWNHSSTFQSIPTLKTTIKKTKKKNSKSQIKKGAKKTQTMHFELRSSARQQLYGYDTVQGSTSDGKYGYYILYNRNVEKCKIAKIRLSTMKRVKVSKALPVAHGNEITYNSKKKRLIVTHLNIDPLAVSIVNPKTLKVESKKTIKFPSSLPGATASQLKKAKAKGFLGITYDAKKNQYAGLLVGVHNIVIMDESFKPVRYVTTEWKNDQLTQGIISSGAYLMIYESGETTLWNSMLVYTWDGEYVGKWKLFCGAEIESVYFAKGKMYMSVYHTADKSFTETKYVKKKVKGVEKYVKKKITYLFPRANCVYQIKGF